MITNVSGSISKSRYFLFPFCLALMALLLSGCAGSKPGANGGANNSAGGDLSATVDESFDPLSLNDDDLHFPDNGVVNPGGNDSGDRDNSGTSSSSGNDAAPQNQEVDGYRVQLFATRDIDKATRQKKEVEFSFARDGDPVAVYIEFNSPIWKVRVGDCRDRESAQVLQQRARDRGYEGAFIVKARVNSHPQLPGGSGAQ